MSKRMQQRPLIILTLLASLVLVELASVSESPITNNYALQGSASIATGSYIQLTTTQTGQASRAIYLTPQDLGSAFTVRASYSGGSCDPDGGADGWSFFFTGLNATTLATYPTLDGHYVALQGIPNIAAVIYDLYSSRLFVCSVSATQPLNVYNTTNHCQEFQTPGLRCPLSFQTTIDYQYPDTWQVVTSSGGVNITAKMPFSLTSPDGKYYMGVTGGTGSQYMRQVVTGWAFTSYNPCVTSGNCSAQATCTPLSKTTFSCACKAGYYGNGYTCAPPSCTDKILNGNETDVDCGGGCLGCASGKTCSKSSDCVSARCVANTCAVPTCNDNVKNGDETDVDCGGSCKKCSDGSSCSVNTDCSSQHCTNSKCAAPTCSDGIKNQDETDVDCGGDTCQKCPANASCNDSNDCISLHCDSSKCLNATCSDGIKNQDESDIDCGGDTCPKCSNLQACTDNTDCASLHCDNSACVAASCLDGFKNNDETDIDCGGLSCNPCDDNKMCLIAADCTSLHCSNLSCVPATCHDGIKNQNETDTDCGGSCGPCADQAKCQTNSDCLSLHCAHSICVANELLNLASATCNDGIYNQNESDIDCGGSCNGCTVGKHCLHDADCANMTCQSTTCVDAPVEAPTPTSVGPISDVTSPVTGTQVVSSAVLSTPVLFVTSIILAL